MNEQKLLLDQNLSYRLVRQIADVFPNAEQVGNLGLYNSDDKSIWQYAKDNDFAIVTFDADFIDFANLYGHPPKIIWLRTGNMTTKAIAEVLKTYHNEIDEFLTADIYKNISCFEID